MTRLCRSFVVAGCALALLAFAPAAMAGHTTDPRTSNLQPLGHIFEPAVLGGFGGGNPDINTDIPSGAIDDCGSSPRVRATFFAGIDWMT